MDPLHTDSLPWDWDGDPAPESAPAEPPVVSSDAPTDVACALAHPRIADALVRRNVPLPPATTIRLRLVAWLLDCPVGQVLMHAAPQFLGTGRPIPERRRGGRALAGEAAHARVALTLHRDTWTAITERATSEGRTIAEFIDGALRPYLARAADLLRAVDALDRDETGGAQ